MGNGQEYVQAAVSLGEALVARDIELVYGGGSIGLMGVLADTMMAGGGRVTGVIPRFLNDREVGHKSLSTLLIVESMHERKQQMAALAHGFLALPGGIGTLEELMEIFTWSQLDLVQNPVAVLNTGGFYDPLIRMLDTMVREGFLHRRVRDNLIVAAGVDQVLEGLLESLSGGPASALEKT
jgi:uncharacterized protein (TIGR00730 family)